MVTLISFFFLALIVSFLCSLLESVLLSVSTTYIAVQVKEEKKSGYILQKLTASINRPLAAILTLNTIANTIGAAGVGAQALKLYGNTWVALITGLLTLSILIFSEIIPKTLGTVYWKFLAGPSAYTIKGLIYITYPFVYLSEAFTGIVRAGSKHKKVSREEMIVMAEMGEDEGSLHVQESEIIENLLRLKDVHAEKVMTPRTVVFALEKGETVGDVNKKHSPIAFSRIPIFKDNLDNIVGFVHRYDLVNKQAEDQFDIRMEEIMEPIHMIQETDSVAMVLDKFVKRRQQIFMVVDEFGSITGIITLEDAIETLLGVEIVDEHDSVVDMRKLALENWKKRRQKYQ